MRIKQFQELIRDIYIKNDLRRGIPRTFMWLVEEIGELSDAILKKDRKSLEEEFADVFAWLCGLANIADVDLESAAKQKYPGYCPRCGNIPCTCNLEPGNPNFRRF
ncbi:MAG: MazG nucleotide pyrophosphohydrolase domain-containing protein [Promethearchaeota archaeon]